MDFPYLAQAFLLSFLVVLAPLRAQDTRLSNVSVRATADATAQVTVTFTNLSAAETSAQLKIGSDFVLNLPLGQVVARAWTFAAIDTYSLADLIRALNTGNLTVSLDSAKYPDGELRGSFITASGARASPRFLCPAPAPLPLDAGA